MLMSAERPSTPEPFINIPFKHDPNYVDRTSITNEIRDRFAQGYWKVALVGLGGIG